MARRAKRNGAANPNPRAVGEEHAVIGQKLRAARLQAGLSQETLGEMLGVSFQQIQKYEKGTNRMDVNRMVECAKVLNVDLDYFIGIPVKGKRPPNKFAAILASREGVKILEAMVRLSPLQLKFLLDIARRLPHLDASA